MTTPLALAWLHLLALGAGLAGVWCRARAIRDSQRNPEDPGAVRRALVGDGWWLAALAAWIFTGLWLLFGSDTGKGLSFYASNQPFLLKGVLFLAVLTLEAWPLMTLLRWRTRKTTPNPRDAGRIEVISYVQCALIVAIALASVVSAHGARWATDASGATPASPTTSSDSAKANAAPTPIVPQPITNEGPRPPEPSGVETVTPDDLALLAREIAMPLKGVDPTRLRSNFDERRGGGAREHQALDMMAARGTPVLSAAKGRVLRLFTSGNGGLMVYAADSSERFILMYAHLDSYAAGLTDSTPIARGQVIGYVGSTGNASAKAPHLHFAVARSADVKRWSKGQPIDPLPPLVASATGRAIGR